jgi:hypothetical protein
MRHVCFLCMELCDCGEQGLSCCGCSTCVELIEGEEQ